MWLCVELIWCDLVVLWCPIFIVVMLSSRVWFRIFVNVIVIYVFVYPGFQNLKGSHSPTCRINFFSLVGNLLYFVNCVFCLCMMYLHMCILYRVLCRLGDVLVIHWSVWWIFCVRYPVLCWRYPVCFGGFLICIFGFWVTNVSSLVVLLYGIVCLVYHCIGKNDAKRHFAVSFLNLNFF